MSINGSTYGNCYPAENADAEIRDATNDTVAEHDEVIRELTAHRDRLMATLDAGSTG